MALDLLGICKAVAANARTAEGLNDSKEFVPDNTAGSPTFWVEIVSVAPSTQGRTRWTVELDGELMVAGGWDRSKQKKAAEMIPLVWTAIGIDRTLGGLAKHLIVTRAQFRRAEDAETGATFSISVEA